MTPVPRIAIAHDYLTQRGGAERVVLAMARAFPDAPIYTTLYEPDLTFPEFADHDVRSASINRWGWARRNHRALLPIFPFVASSMFIDADVVITSSSGWSHGFRTNGRKIVYCYSPARWLYQAEAYLGGRHRSGPGVALQALAPALRRWDKRAAASASDYLAISSIVQSRISDTYGLHSHVVPAPRTLPTHVETTGEAMTDRIMRQAPGFFLCVARLLPYKNVDAVVQAFTDRPERLVVVGKGPELERLRAVAGPNVQFMSDLTDSEMVHAYQRCAAVIAASYEDYGLSPLEAGAAGRPALALRWGGFLDTIADGRTGLFFDHPDVASIRDALDRFRLHSWDARSITAWSERFSEQRFARTLHRIVQGSPGLAGAREPVGALSSESYAPPAA